MTRFALARAESAGIAGYTGRARLLCIQRLLVIASWLFEFCIDFQLGFGTRFIFVLHFGGFRRHFVLLFEGSNRSSSRSAS